MNAIEKALYDKLIADTALTAELIDDSAAYNDIAPQGTIRPYLVFFYAGGGPTNDSPSDTREYVYGVKGLANESKQAGTIQGLIEATLHEKTLTVVGYTNFRTQCEDEIAITETLADGKLVFHRGNFYRIWLDD